MMCFKQKRHTEVNYEKKVLNSDGKQAHLKGVVDTTFVDKVCQCLMASR